MNEDTKVLIVGAGASGLTLACDLQRRGVPYRLIDAAEHGFEGSRAKGVQPRSLEVFDDLGVLPGLEARSTLYPPLGVHLGPLTLRRTMIKHHALSPDVPYPNTLLVPQYATDASLRARLAELGGVVEQGVRLLGFEQAGDSVAAQVEGPGGLATIRSSYLVGADGGGSAVRRGAGIAFVGTTDESDRMIVADLSLTGLSRDRWHVWPRHKGRFMAVCPLPDGKFQLMLKLRPADPADLDQASIERLIHRFTARAKIRVQEIHWTSIWRPNIRLAERYRAGRVFLVGDAAHVHPPTGAQGLNTGIQDAYNLGWKLAQVIDGAPEALLDTYEEERQPVAARVLGLATELYERTSQRPLAATTRGDEERQLALTYRGGPLAPQDAASGVMAGDRAPDAPYVTADGDRGTLFDVFRGPHFTLIALGTHDDASAALAWPAGGAPLRILALGDAANPVLRSTYGIEVDRAQILVRPDGYVAAVVHGDDAAVLGATVAAMVPPILKAA